jgi:hypothetical protein
VVFEKTGLTDGVHPLWIVNKNTKGDSSERGTYINNDIFKVQN